MTIRRLFNVFLEGGLTYENRQVDYRDRQRAGEKFSSNSLRADLGAGTSVFINQNTSVDLGANLNQGFQDGDDLYFDGYLRLKFWF